MTMTVYSTEKEEQIVGVAALWTCQNTGKIEFQVSRPTATEWESSLPARIYHCGPSLITVVYTQPETPDSKAYSRWLDRWQSVEYRIPSKHFLSVEKKNISTSLRLNIANKHPSPVCLVHADDFGDPVAEICFRIATAFRWRRDSVRIFGLFPLHSW
jgi:hypothetical protein